MNIKITKRDLLFFALGFLSLFIIAVVYDRESNVEAFTEGMSEGRRFSQIEIH